MQVREIQHHLVNARQKMNKKGVTRMAYSPRLSKKMNKKLADGKLGVIRMKKVLTSASSAAAARRYSNKTKLHTEHFLEFV